MIELNPIITTTRKGKELKRYNVQIKKSADKFTPNVNIGVTPRGTRYYRALLPDKSWGSLYMLKRDGSEVIVDSCSANYGIQSSVLNKKSNGIITSDRFVEHIVGNGESKNIVHSDRMVGQTSKTYVQDEVKQAISYLAKKVDIFKNPPKESFWKKFWNVIK